MIRDLYLSVRFYVWELKARLRAWVTRDKGPECER